MKRLFLCSSFADVANLFVDCAKIPSHFHHSTHNVRSYKAAAWLVQRVGGSLCMHISLSLICFLPFIFSLLYVCNCLFTTVTKFNYSSG